VDNVPQELSFDLLRFGFQMLVEEIPELTRDPFKPDRIIASFTRTEDYRNAVGQSFRVGKDKQQVLEVNNERILIFVFTVLCASTSYF
jgi:hypothetical protein